MLDDTQNRRRFLTTFSAAGILSLAGARHALSAESVAETDTVRLPKIRGTCIARQYVAEDLLRSEGFTDIRYVEVDAGFGQAKAVSGGEIDFTVKTPANLSRSLPGRTWGASNCSRTRASAPSGT